MWSTGWENYGDTCDQGSDLMASCALYVGSAFRYVVGIGKPDFSPNKRVMEKIIKGSVINAHARRGGWPFEGPMALTGGL